LFEFLRDSAFAFRLHFDVLRNDANHRDAVRGRTGSPIHQGAGEDARGRAGSDHPRPGRRAAGELPPLPGGLRSDERTDALKETKLSLRAGEILDRLEKLYPDADCELNFKNA